MIGSRTLLHVVRLLLGFGLAGSASAQTFAAFPLPTPGSRPSDIVAGPDGNLWFTEEDNRIGRITPDGLLTEFPNTITGALPNQIAAGPDGNIWFTETIPFSKGQIGRITSTGDIRHFGPDQVGWIPFDIVAGPDGNLWFTRFDSRTIQRITTLGVITGFELPMPTAPGSAAGITSGPGGALWSPIRRPMRLAASRPLESSLSFPSRREKGRHTASLRGLTARCGSPCPKVTRSGA